MAVGLTLGVRYDNPAIPPVAEATTYVDFGRLRIGVEYRVLTDEAFDAAFADMPDVDAVRLRAENRVDEDRGPSVHVVDGTDGFEYLRFDLFEVEPHYHYIGREPDGLVFQRVVTYDAAAFGDPIEWATGCLRQRLPAMLRVAGGGELAVAVEALDTVAIATSIGSRLRSLATA
jgi:hypothetical protein